MNTEEKSASENRSETGPEKHIEPRGSRECADRAVNSLGPFKYKTRDEALRYSPASVRIRISEEVAIERVDVLAKQFNQVEFLNNGAPRRKDVVDNLNKLEELAAGLAEFMTSLDDFTRRRLQTAGSGNDLYRTLFSNQVMKNAYVDALPHPSSPGGDGNDCAWMIALNALSQYAGFVRTNFLLSKGIEDPDKADRGGNTNLAKELYGPARQYFVQEGWYVYDMFKPGEASGTEGGAFHLFLCDVFEYATGKEPEEHSKLMPFIKTACRVNRRLKALRLRENELLIELNDLPPTRANQRRTDEIEQEAASVWGEIYELLGEVWPPG